MKLTAAGFFVLYVLSLANCAANASVRLSDLRCEYQTDPVGMDGTHPRLSWILTSDRRGERQTGYQVLVASTPGGLRKNRGDLWDTGKVASDQSIQLEYAGKPLISRVRCCWKVRVWDRDGAPSPWSAPSTWTMGLLHPGDWRAKWIGTEDAAPASKPVHLLITRAVYEAPDGAGSVDVTVRLASLVKPTGLSLIVGNEILGGDPAPNHKKRLRVNYELDGKRFDQTITETDGLSIPEGVAAPTGSLPVPRYLRKSFNIDKPVRRATVYVTALGMYELRLNGEKVGDHLLAPEWTSYHKHLQYQTFDVTSLLRPGANAMGAILGNGWYCGLWQHWPPRAGIWGDRPWLLAQLEIEDTQGNVRVIAETSGLSLRMPPGKPQRTGHFVSQGSTRVRRTTQLGRCPAGIARASIAQSGARPKLEHPKLAYWSGSEASLSV